MTSGEIVSASVEIEVIGGLVTDLGPHAEPSKPACVSPEVHARAEPCVKRRSEPEEGASGNGLLPFWRKARLSCVSWHPEYAFLRLVVYRASRGYAYRAQQPIAYEVIPLTALRAGYRSVALRSPGSGSRIHECALLIEVLKQPATVEPPRGAPPLLLPTGSPDMPPTPGPLGKAPPAAARRMQLASAVGRSPRRSSIVKWNKSKFSAVVDELRGSEEGDAAPKPGAGAPPPGSGTVLATSAHGAAQQLEEESPSASSDAGASQERAPVGRQLIKQLSNLDRDSAVQLACAMLEAHASDGEDENPEAAPAAEPSVPARPHPVRASSFDELVGQGG